MAVIVNVSMDPDHDKDILQWLENQSNKSLAVRKAIRAYMAQEDGVTLADVLAEIRGLPARLSVVAVAPPTVPTAADEGEPEAAAANVDGLLARLGDGDWD